MASDVHEKPMVYSKVQPQPQPLPLPLPVVQPAEKTGSVTDTLVAPSPSASVECGALSGLTSHSTKYISEAEASSCSEVCCASPYKQSASLTSCIVSLLKEVQAGTEQLGCL